VVLGSGLSHLTDALADPVAVPFEALPGLPPSGVAGHTGRFLHGRLGGAEVLLQAGRYHAYEGHSLDVVVAPVRILARLGVRVLVLTNAAGGLNAALEPGDLVLVDDHVNFMFRSPLVGPVIGGEERFLDMSAPYDRGLQELALAAAAERGVTLVRGTYAAVLGPSYETAAEVRMLRGLGADVVGMSTVPEVIAARANGLRCLAFSMVTNKGTGLADRPLAHDDVLAVGRDAGARLAGVIEGVLRRLATQSTGTK
jgi:purine-nucleoside phosphorylase